MRQGETEYWDSVAEIQLKTNRDNIWKKGQVVSRIFADGDFIGQKVLEIGIGNALAISAVHYIYGGNFKYAGTDVSKLYVDTANKRFGNRFHQASITKLPETEGGWTRIMCLDSLEHVNPADREDGFREINRVMSPKGKIVINLPGEKTTSYHNDEYDFQFGLRELALLSEITATRMKKFETYSVVCGQVKLEYRWCILER